MPTFGQCVFVCLRGHSDNGGRAYSQGSLLSSWIMPCICGEIHFSRWAATVTVRGTGGQIAFDHLQVAVAQIVPHGELRQKRKPAAVFQHVHNAVGALQKVGKEQRLHQPNAQSAGQFGGGVLRCMRFFRLRGYARPARRHNSRYTWARRG